MIRSVRTFFAALLRKYPCCGAFTAIAVTVVPFLLYPEAPFSLLMIPASLFLILAGFFVSPCNLLVRLAFPALFAACSVLIHQHLYKTDDLCTAFAGGPGRAAARIRVDDASASPGFSAAKGKKNWKVRVLSLQKEGCPPENMSSYAMVVIPAELSETTGYGDVLDVSGLFLRPNDTLADGAFDYKDYLTRQMVFYCLKVDGLKPVSRGCGFIRFLLDCRDKLLDRICSSLSPDVRCLAAGIFFGVRSGIPPETKQDFLSSGMVHILSVSGTHVMMFSLLILFLFAPLPMRIRTCLVILLTFCYALSTGMKEPACRAFLMFALFLGLRAFLLRSIPFNTLALAACILVIRDPFALASPGFQYSFLTVGALLLTAPFVRHWLFPASERMLLIPNRWMPIRLIHYEVRWKHYVSVLASCMTAWLISLPLSLLYQGIWPGASVFANLLAIPLIGLSFFLFLCASLFCCVPFIFTFFVSLLDLCLHGIVFCAGVFSGFRCDLPFVPVWMAILFLLLFFLLLQTRTVKSLLICLTLCVFTAISLYTAKFFMPAEAVCLTNGENCSLAVISPALSSASVIELPDYGSAREMASYLTSKGIKHCDICFRSKGKEKDFAFAEFARRIHVYTTCFCGPGESPHSRIRHVSTYPVDVYAWNGKMIFSLQSADGGCFSGRITRLDGGGLHLFMKDVSTGKILTDRDIFPSTRYCFLTYPLGH